MAVVCFKHGFTGAADEAMSDMSKHDTRMPILPRNTYTTMQPMRANLRRIYV
jgi:hypothetical protein